MLISYFGEAKKNNLYLFDLYMRYLQKYWVSFCLYKCEFIKICVEYVGHNTMQDGNAPAQSKYNIIKDGKLLENG